MINSWKRTTGLILSAVVALGARPIGATERGDSTFIHGAALAVGEVEGVVTLSVPDESAPTMLSPYARRRYTPPPATSASANSPQNVIVYIIVKGQSSRAAGAVITQRNRAILPQATVVQLGGRIDFPNEDSVYHNLFSLSGPKQFNLGRYAPGTSKSVTFDKPGVVRLFCDIHSEMSGTILVLDTPYYTRPDQNGSFHLRGIPEGRHTLIAWHESTGSVSTEITVTGGSVTRADITVGG